MKKKPYPEFPLTAHPRGWWVKKINGKQHYFGKISEGWKPALERYKETVDDLQAGRTPRPATDSLTVGDLFNEYLAAAEARVEAGEMQRDSWLDSKRSLKLAARVLGKHYPIDSLRPADFERVRGELVRKYALATVVGHVARIKTALKWAYDAEWVDKPIRTGPRFRKPPASQLRRERAQKAQKLFTRDEVTWLIENSTGQMKAMVLLGINCALGNRDCGELEFRHLDLAGGWLTYPRPKTGIGRRAKLWPVTVEAIEAVLASRKEPHDAAYAQRVFITKYRTPWAKADSRVSPVSQEFTKLLTAGDMVKKGRGFYSLRHTFQTEADGVRDQPAASYVMGHVDSTMAGIYRERIDDSRLVAVADYVEAWLFGNGEALKVSA